ncbi:hypothetical protein GGI25_000895 [Coemansia spiralis]|uniref:Splicing factor Cactin n=2 Tax=Coemansia TaxID=4863 RepID=A0A9W8KZ26_9FUNG|nr:cactus-binding C-terminus of cactin protein-domain-containing protein [Coemansia spiralis]KAJ1994068.1 hypothetical protein EDC05_001738 [Coemansia umbellata]KAJ2623632.1 hypothetical protein GGI26_002270 [Coemansia sp. RSA 1358]KAJ2680302.1 hypothetical protein GGI25_000895 [Coemansia spiralis]
MPRDSSADRHGRSSHRSRNSGRRNSSRSPERGRSSRSSRNRSISLESARSKKKRSSKHTLSRSHKRDDRHKRKGKYLDSDERDSDSENEATVAGKYTNTDNPFNDEALGKKFVWKKKIEQDKARGLSKEEMEEADRRRREEAEKELENLRKRRELRELEQKQREEEMKRIRREQEQENLGDWERREEEFHLQQAKKRAEIRIKHHRPKHIDILAMNLRLANDDLNAEEIGALGGMRIDVDEPHMIVDGLSEDGCEELLHDVEMYLSLENNTRNVEFWENMLVVCTSRLEEARVARVGGIGSRSAISQEVKDVLAGKSLKELLQLEEDVLEKLSGRSGAVDVDYWEQVRSQLGVEKAKATLAEMHQNILERRLERLHEARRMPGSRDSAIQQQAGSEYADRESSNDVEQRKRHRLEELQRRILDGQQPAGAAELEGDVDGSDSIERSMYEAELKKEHDPSEAVFSVEAAIPSKHYSWQDKHRPRKPRYFNRVHTGYEWNKYNQTHYDKDNPPPKVVQGYKFNIFYPDLIDKLQAPTYRVEKDPAGGDETVVLRFTAGPPYEDIAFRIVNREWEYNRRRGFRNTFDRGVLQLYFRFKRHHYRR